MPKQDQLPPLVLGPLVPDVPASDGVANLVGSQWQSTRNADWLQFQSERILAEVSFGFPILTFGRARLLLNVNVEADWLPTF